MVTMSRYSTNSACSQTRPCPGMICVPPSFHGSGIDGMARSIRRFSASISPWMVPPRWTSMTGKRVMSKTSPVAITSERRKKTMLSPSVWAAGWEMT